MRRRSRRNENRRRADDPESLFKFNIHAQAAVLELGSLPLPLVTARIDRFIAEGGKGPYPDME